MKKTLILGLSFVGLLLFSNVQAEVSTNSKVTGVLTSENVFSEYSGDANFSDVTADNIEVGDGSVANPSVKVGDEENGLSSPAANTLSISADGIEVIRANTAASGVNYLDVTASATTDAVEIASAGTDTDIDIAIMPKGTGNVGIGTAAPTKLVTLANGDASGTPTIRIQTLSGGTVSWDFIHAQADRSLTLQSNTGLPAGSPFIIKNQQSSGESLRITGLGNVGIREANPNSTFHANGSVSTAFNNVSSAAVAVDATFYRIDCLTNGNDVTLNLPTAVGVEGRCHPVRIVNASGNKCFLEGAGSETLSPDGVNFFLNYSGLNTSGENVDICSDGANWQVWE